MDVAKTATQAAITAAASTRRQEYPAEGQSDTVVMQATSKDENVPISRTFLIRRCRRSSDMV
jgi:hypothetical protein